MRSTVREAVANQLRGETMNAPVSVSRLQQHDRYTLLDGMRGVAAIAVMMLHLGWQVDLQTVLFPHAYLAVDFFFMLSGFVIAGSYERRLADGGMSVGKFIVLRIFRLYPMIILGTVVAVIIRLFLAGGDPGDYVSNHLFAAAVANMALEPVLFFPGEHFAEFRFPLNNPMWSLFWELLVNILFACAVVWKGAGARTWYVITILGVLLLIPFALTHNGLGRGDHEWLGGLVRVTFAFFCGVAIWHLRPYLQRIIMPVALQLAVLLLVLACPLLPHINALFDIGVALCIFPVVIAAACNSRLSARSTAVASWLGGISYPLYALHYPFMSVIENAYRKGSWTPVEALVNVIVIGTLMVVVSHLVLVMIDEPVRGGLRSMLVKRTKPRA